ncbi:MAG: ParB/RepB/Spo0J family partition protein [Pseudolysinimonas sp.]
MATATSTRRLERIPIDKIVTGLNVRGDATPDPDLVASVKANGILQPPTVTPVDDGNYEVVIGHRRANAAALAGQKDLEAIVVDAAMAEDVRLIDQLTENDQRLQLTDAERAGGYKQLELFSVSPAQIARRLGVKRDRVDTILTVAGNEHATKAVAEFGIPLDQAAEIVAFADDKGATNKLIAAAESSPASFAHTLRQVREEVDLKTEKARLHTELEAAGVTRLKDVTYSGDRPSDDNAQWLRSWATAAAPTVELTVADLTKEQTAARVVTGWGLRPDGSPGNWPSIQYFVLNPEGNGFVKLQYETTVPSRDLSPEEAERREAQRIESEKADQHRAALESARQVRTEWLTTVLQRAKLPEYYGLLAWTLTYNGYLSDEGEVSINVVNLLGLPHPDDFDPGDAADLLRGRIGEDTKFAPRMILAILFDHCESEIAPRWHHPDELDITYLETLAAWGYGLSDAENNLITRPKQTPPMTRTRPGTPNDRRQRLRPHHQHRAGSLRTTTRLGPALQSQRGLLAPTLEQPQQ